MICFFISDFGFAVGTVKDRPLETYCGSFAYCCPQILRGRPYDGKKADVWSMGVVLYAMGCARLPFSENDMRNLIKDDYTNKIKFSKRVSKGMAVILTENVRAIFKWKAKVLCVLCTVYYTHLTRFCNWCNNFEPVSKPKR